MQHAAKLKPGTTRSKKTSVEGKLQGYEKGQPDHPGDKQTGAPADIDLARDIRMPSSALVESAAQQLKVAKGEETKLQQTTATSKTIERVLVSTKEETDTSKVWPSETNPLHSKQRIEGKLAENRTLHVGDTPSGDTGVVNTAEMQLGLLPDPMLMGNSAVMDVMHLFQGDGTQQFHASPPSLPSPGVNSDGMQTMANSLGESGATETYAVNATTATTPHSREELDMMEVLDVLEGGDQGLDDTFRTDGHHQLSGQDQQPQQEAKALNIGAPSTCGHDGSNSPTLETARSVTTIEAKHQNVGKQTACDPSKSNPSQPANDVGPSVVAQNVSSSALKGVSKGLQGGSAMGTPGAKANQRAPMKLVPLPLHLMDKYAKSEKQEPGAKDGSHVPIKQEPYQQAPVQAQSPSDPRHLPHSNSSKSGTAYPVAPSSGADPSQPNATPGKRSQPHHPGDKVVTKQVPNKPRGGSSTVVKKGSSGTVATTAAAGTDKKEKKKREQQPKTSQYRGVTLHRRSGRWEAHAWSARLKKQVYLGGFETEEDAAEAHDIFSLKCKKDKAVLNFSVGSYSPDLLRYLDSITDEELAVAVRRQSTGFTRGRSKYRGITKHPHGKWEARIGAPNASHVYLGLYDTEEEAARAHDKALVLTKGRTAITNFNITEYSHELFKYELSNFESRQPGVDTSGAKLSGDPSSVSSLSQGRPIVAQLRASSQAPMSSGSHVHPDLQANPYSGRPSKLLRHSLSVDRYGNEGFGASNFDNLRAERSLERRYSLPALASGRSRGEPGIQTGLREQSQTGRMPQSQRSRDYHAHPPQRAEQGPSPPVPRRGSHFPASALTQEQRHSKRSSPHTNMTNQQLEAIQRAIRRNRTSEQAQKQSQQPHHGIPMSPTMSLPPGQEYDRVQHLSADGSIDQPDQYYASQETAAHQALFVPTSSLPQSGGGVGHGPVSAHKGMYDTMMDNPRGAYGQARTFEHHESIRSFAGFQDGPLQTGISHHQPFEQQVQSPPSLSQQQHASDRHTHPHRQQHDYLPAHSFAETASLDEWHNPVGRGGLVEAMESYPGFSSSSQNLDLDVSMLYQSTADADMYSIFKSDISGAD